MERDEAQRRANDNERRAAEVQRTTQIDRGDELAKVAEVQKLRDQIVSMAENADNLMQQNNKLLEEKAGIAEQIGAAEQALQAARQEIFELRAQALAAKDETTTNILRAFADASTTAALSDPSPTPAAFKSLTQYCKVLQHTLGELQEGQASLQHQLHEAQYLEMQARRLLADAREKEAQALRAMELHSKRTHALERCVAFPATPLPTLLTLLAVLSPLHPLSTGCA